MKVSRTIAPISCLGGFQQGCIEAVGNFPDFDRSGDGQVTWDGLLFAVTLGLRFGF